MTTSPATRLGRGYYDALTHLRNASRRTKWDAALAARPGAKIHYIFDANVFVFHANIRDKSKQINDLAGLLGVSADDPFLLAMERLTSDYMFSGHLPAQSHSTAYISSPHFDEVISKIYEVEAKIDEDIHEPTFAREAALYQKRVQEILLSGGQGREAKLAEIQKILPTAWLGSLQARTHFNSVIDSAFLSDKPAVTPLHNVDWGWEAGRPLQSDIDQWSLALGEGAPNRDRNRAHDALTLATIVELYRNNRLSKYDTRTNLYVFITSDIGILSVVGRRLSILHAEGIPYFVRTPKDFFPLLNISAMGDVYADKDENQKAQLTKVADLEEETLNWSEFDPARAAQPTTQGSARPIEDLQSAWKALSEASTLLNAKYIELSNREIFNGLTEFISDSYEVSLKSMASKLDKVRQLHVDAVLDTALFDAKRANAGSDSALTRRVQLKPISTNIFQELIGAGITVTEFVDRSINKGTLDRTVEKKILAEPSNPAAAMLVACLFLASENWQSATEFSTQAKESVDGRSPPALQEEAAYLNALCLRFSMDGDNDFVRAANLLRNNLTGYRAVASPEIVWRRLRDQIERATLYLSAAVMQAALEAGAVTHGDRPKRGAFMPIGQAPRYFLSGLQNSEQSFDELSGNFANHWDDKNSPWHDLSIALKVQVITNLAGGLVFSRALPGYATPTLSRDVILQNLRDIIDEAKTIRRPLREAQHIYERVLTAFETNGETQRAAIDDALKRIATVENHSRSLPVNDRIRFRFLAAWLKKQRKEALPKD